MKNKLKLILSRAKARMAGFLRVRGIYVVAMACVAAIGLAAALSLTPIAEEPVDPDAGGPNAGAPVSRDDSERLAQTTPSPTLSQPTPALSPAQALTPVPDFTQAPATPVVTEKPRLSPPVRGEIVWGYAVNELIYSRTLNQWMTHAGVDVAAPKGTEVNAVFGGSVSRVAKDDALGVMVEVTGSSGMTAVYANLKEEPPVKEGGRVSAGDVVGYVGDTAVSECGEQSHVHFELLVDGKYVDPGLYIRFVKELSSEPRG